MPTAAEYWVRMSELAATILQENRDAGRTVAVVESCTGGMVMAALTSVPGASDVFDRGYVVYSDEAKVQTLGVGSDIIETFGSVSVAAAWAMAVAAIEKSGADVAVSVTGIAGPDGGSEKKPVGTVVFGRARKGQNPDHIHTDLIHFEPTNRDEIRRLAALHALELLSPSRDEEEEEG